MKSALIVFVTAFFLVTGVYGADAPKPTAAEQDKQLSLEDARSVVIINYLQGQIDQLKEYRVRIKDARANLGKAAPKAEKKAPVKPVEQTSQGVKPKS